MMYRSNFQKFLTFSMCSNQLVMNQPTKTNRMAANDGQLKLKILDVPTSFQCENWK